MARKTTTRKVKKPKRPKLETKLRKNRLLTVREVAEYLDLAEVTIYRWAREGHIPSIRMGRSWRFRVNEINKWLEKAGRRQFLS